MGPQPLQFLDADYLRLLDILGIDQSLQVQEKVLLLKEIPEKMWSTVSPQFVLDLSVGLYS
jgi:hypothetical protein